MLDSALQEFDNSTRWPVLSWGMYTTSSMSAGAITEALGFTHGNHNSCRIADFPTSQQDIIIVVYMAFYIRRVLEEAGNRLQVWLIYLSYSFCRYRDIVARIAIFHPIWALIPLYCQHGLNHTRVVLFFAGSIGSGLCETTRIWHCGRCNRRFRRF